MIPVLSSICKAEHLNEKRVFSCFMNMNCTRDLHLQVFASMKYEKENFRVYIQIIYMLQW